MLILSNEFWVVMMLVVVKDNLFVELYLLHHKHEEYWKEDPIHKLLKLNDHFEEDQLVPAIKN